MLLSGSAFRPLFAHSPRDAEHLRASTPLQAVIVDLTAGVDGFWDALANIRRGTKSPAPVLAATVDDDRDRALALGATDVISRPESAVQLLAALRSVITGPEVARVLLIDDDDVSRYVVRKHLEGEPVAVIETTNGRDGLEIAVRERPDVIVLDLVMPEMSGFQVLEELGRDRTTRDIPVVIHTSKTSYSEEQERLTRRARKILSKTSLEAEDLRSAVRLALASRQ
jgi:CheY-like chemotaxis protein